MKYFDAAQIINLLQKAGKIFLYLILTVLVGIFIGFMVAGQNPFQVFLPSTWTHVFEFLS